MDSTSATVQEITVAGQQLCGLTWMNQLLWYSDAALEQILAVDPASGELVHRLPCPGVRTDLSSINGRLLQVVHATRNLRVIDPNTGTAVAEIGNPRPSGLLCGIEATGAAVWLGYKDPPVLDLRKQADWTLIASIPVQYTVAGMTVVERYIAFADYVKALIVLLDPRTQQNIATLAVDGNPTGLTWDGHLLWYCDHTHKKLRAIETPKLVVEQ